MLRIKVKIITQQCKKNIENLYLYVLNQKSPFDMTKNKQTNNKQRKPQGSGRGKGEGEEGGHIQNI